MKKTFKLIALFAFAMLFVVSACKKDDDDDTTNPTDENPIVNFLVEAGYVSADVILTPGEAFKVKVRVAENPTTKKNIDKLEVSRIKNNQTTPDTTVIVGSADETIELQFNAQMAEGAETFEFKAIDNDGKFTIKRFVVTTVGPGVAVNKYAGIILGSYNDNTYGSFFSTSTNEVFFKTDVQANLAKVDFAFSLGTSSNLSTIFSLSDSYYSNAYFQETWTGANITKFEFPAPIDAPTFDAIVDFFQFPAFSGTSSFVNLLVPDNVIYFETAAGKYGFIKVNQINDKGDIINIDVIVEN